MRVALVLPAMRREFEKELRKPMRLAKSESESLAPIKVARGVFSKRPYPIVKFGETRQLGNGVETMFIE